MKVLKTAAIVIGAVALVATGIGAVAVPGFLGMSAATLATIQTIGTVATLASSAISLGAALFSPRPGFGGGGSPLDFQTNPQSGLPYAIGRTRMSGVKVAGATASSPGWTASHDLLFFAALLSCAGPAHAIESFAADNVTISFDGGTGAATTGGHAGWMAQKVSLGATPQPAALSLSLNGGAFPGWTASHKLSGLAHALWAMRHDSDGGHYSGGVPEPAWVGRWVKVYDPRMDSSYPGGSGSQRANDEATWAWSRNPALHALAWAIGRHSNGKLVCGIGAPIANIRVADFVEAANVADANGWGCGGVEWTTEPKWDVFKRMLQAGGAVPVKTGAMIGCRVRTPRVSLGTIESGDFLGELVWPSSKPRRERFNSALPRYVSESHGWEVVTGSEVSVPGWVTEDGGKRTKGIDLPLVQAEVGQAGYDGADQAGQLATYEIADSRETGPIEFATGPKWIGLRCGDCVVLNRPEDDIVSQKVVITGRTIDPANGSLRFTAETETDSKHAFALGETSSAPPAPTLSVPAGRPAVPGGSAWSVSAVALADGQPGLRLAGAIDDLIADRVLVNYRPHGATDWIVAPDITGTGERTLDLGPLDGEAGWDVRLAYRAGEQTGDWLEISDVATGASAIIAGIAGKVRQGTVLPLAADCAEGDLFILTNWGNRAFVRVAGDGLLRNNGDLVLNNGESIGVSVWQEVTDTRVAQAIADAAAAQASADAAQARVDAVTSDDVITAGAEKRQIVSDVTWLLNEHAALDAKALAIGAASGERSAANAAIAALNAYLAGLSPAWDDAAHDTGLDGATLAGLFADATDKVTLLQAAIQGLPGESVAELTIYRANASAPATPTGGSYDIATRVLTPPSGWSLTMPTSGTRWSASGYAAFTGPSGTVTPTWLGVGGGVTDGAAGGDGADGQASDIVFRRSATQPATPADSAGVPAGWYGTTGAVPAGSDPMWASFRTRATPASAWVHQAASRIEGEDGADGADGLSNAIVYLYQRAASTPAVPSTTSTYTFATKALTGFDNGWATTIPAGSDPLYVIAATASGTGATDTIGSGEWSAPVVLAQDGANGTNGTNGTDGAAGLNAASVFIYQRATSAPAVPSTTATYTFATAALSGHNNGWTQAIPAGSDPLYVTIATAASTGSTDTIATGEWSTPRVLAQNGTSAISASATPPAVLVACTANGTPKAAVAGFQIKAFQGDTDITASASYSHTSSGLSGVSHGGAGAYTVSGMSAETGHVEVTISHGGAEQVVRVPYSKSRDGAAYVYDNETIITPTSTSYAEVASISLLMGPDGTLNAAANGHFTGDSGTVNVDGYMEYSLNGGGSWATLSGSTFTGIPSTAGEAGDFSSAASVSGSSISLSAKQTVMVRLMMRRSNTIDIIDWAGNFSVDWTD